MLLYIIGKDRIYYDYTMDLVTTEKGQRFANSVIKKDTTPKDKISFMENFDMYIRHMESLNLVFWRKDDETAVYEDGNQTGTYIFYHRTNSIWCFIY